MTHTSKVSTLDEINGWLQAIAGRLTALEQHVCDRRFKEAEMIRSILGFETNDNKRSLRQEIWKDLRATSVISGMLTAEELQTTVDKLEDKGKVQHLDLTPFVQALRKSKRKGK